MSVDAVGAFFNKDTLGAIGTIASVGSTMGAVNKFVHDDTGSKSAAEMYSSTSPTYSSNKPNYGSNLKATLDNSVLQKPMEQTATAVTSMSQTIGEFNKHLMLLIDRVETSNQLLQKIVDIHTGKAEVDIAKLGARESRKNLAIARTSLGRLALTMMAKAVGAATSAFTGPGGKAIEKSIQQGIISAQELVTQNMLSKIPIVGKMFGDMDKVKKKILQAKEIYTTETDLTIKHVIPDKLEGIGEYLVDIYDEIHMMNFNVASLLANTTNYFNIAISQTQKNATILAAVLSARAKDKENNDDSNNDSNSSNINISSINKIYDLFKDTPSDIRNIKENISTIVSLMEPTESSRSSNRSNININQSNIPLNAINSTLNRINTNLNNNLNAINTNLNQYLNSINNTNIIETNKNINDSINHYTAASTVFFQSLYDYYENYTIPYFRSVTNFFKDFSRHFADPMLQQTSELVPIFNNMKESLHYIATMTPRGAGPGARFRPAVPRNTADANNQILGTATRIRGLHQMSTNPNDRYGFNVNNNLPDIVTQLIANLTSTINDMNRNNLLNNKDENDFSRVLENSISRINTRNNENNDSSSSNSNNENNENNAQNIYRVLNDYIYQTLLRIKEKLSTISEDIKNLNGANNTPILESLDRIKEAIIDKNAILDQRVIDIINKENKPIEEMMVSLDQSLMEMVTTQHTDFAALIHNWDENSSSIRNIEDTQLKILPQELAILAQEKDSNEQFRETLVQQGIKSLNQRELIRSNTNKILQNNLSMSNTFINWFLKFPNFLTKFAGSAVQIAIKGMLIGSVWRMFKAIIWGEKVQPDSEGIVGSVFKRLRTFTNFFGITKSGNEESGLLFTIKNKIIDIFNNLITSPKMVEARKVVKEKFKDVRDQFIIELKAFAKTAISFIALFRSKSLIQKMLLAIKQRTNKEATLADVSIGKALHDFYEKIRDHIGQLIEDRGIWGAVTKLTSDIGSYIIGIFSSIKNGIVSIFSAISTTISVVKYTLNETYRFSKYLKNAIIEQLRNTFGDKDQVIYWKNVKKFMRSKFDNIKKSLGDTLDNFGKAIRSSIGTEEHIISLKRISEQISTGLKNFSSQIKNALWGNEQNPKILQRIANSVSIWWNETTKMQKFLHAITGPFVGSWHAVKYVYINAVNIGNNILGIWSDFNSWYNGKITGLKNKWEKFKNRTSIFFDNTITNVGTSILKFYDGFKHAGKNLTQILIYDINKAEERAQKALSKDLNKGFWSLTDRLKKSYKKHQERLQNIVNVLNEPFKNAEGYDKMMSDVQRLETSNKQSIDAIRKERIQELQKRRKQLRDLKKSFQDAEKAFMQAHKGEENYNEEIAKLRHKHKTELQEARNHIKQQNVQDRQQLKSTINEMNETTSQMITRTVQNFRNNVQKLDGTSVFKSRIKAIGLKISDMVLTGMNAIGGALDLAMKSLPYVGIAIMLVNMAVNFFKGWEMAVLGDKAKNLSLGEKIAFFLEDMFVKGVKLLGTIIFEVLPKVAIGFVGFLLRLPVTIGGVIIDAIVASGDVITTIVKDFCVNIVKGIFYPILKVLSFFGFDPFNVDGNAKEVANQKKAEEQRKKKEEAEAKAAEKNTQSIQTLNESINQGFKNIGSVLSKTLDFLKNTIGKIFKPKTLGTMSGGITNAMRSLLTAFMPESTARAFEQKEKERTSKPLEILRKQLLDYGGFKAEDFKEGGISLVHNTPEKEKQLDEAIKTLTDKDSDFYKKFKLDEKDIYSLKTQNEALYNSTVETKDILDDEKGKYALGRKMNRIVELLDRNGLKNSEYADDIAKAVNGTHEILSYFINDQEKDIVRDQFMKARANGYTGKFDNFLKSLGSSYVTDEKTKNIIAKYYEGFNKLGSFQKEALNFRLMNGNREDAEIEYMGKRAGDVFGGIGTAWWDNYETASSLGLKKNKKDDQTGDPVDTLASKYILFADRNPDGHNGTIVNAFESFSKVNPQLQHSIMGAAKDFYNETGMKLRINSSWRNQERQAQLYNDRDNNAYPVAKPSAFTSHILGNAIDINRAQAQYMASNGILEKNNLIQPSPFIDPVHIEYGKLSSKKNDRNNNPYIDMFYGSNNIGDVSMEEVDNHLWSKTGISFATEMLGNVLGTSFLSPFMGPAAPIGTAIGNFLGLKLGDLLNYFLFNKDPDAKWTDAFGNNTKNIIDMGLSLASAYNWFSKAFRGIKSGIKFLKLDKLFGKAISGLKWTGGKVLDLFGGTAKFIGKGWEFTKSLFSGAKNYIGKLFDPNKPGLLGGIGRFFKGAKDLKDRIINWDNFKLVAGKGWQAIKFLGGGVWKIISTIFGKSWEFIKKLALGGWNKVKSYSGPGSEKIKSLGETWNSIQEFFSKSELLGKVKSNLTGLWNKIYSWFGKKGTDKVAGEAAEGATKQPWWSRILGKKVTDKVAGEAAEGTTKQSFWAKWFKDSKIGKWFSRIFGKKSAQEGADVLAEGATKQSWWSKWFGGDSRIGKWFSGIFGKKGAQEGADALVEGATKQSWWSRILGKKATDKVAGEAAEGTTKQSWWSKWFKDSRIGKWFSGIFGKKGAQEGADALVEGATKQSWWSKWFGGDSRIGKWFKDSRIGKWFSGIFGKKGADALAETVTKQPWWSRVLGKKVTDKVAGEAAEGTTKQSFWAKWFKDSKIGKWFSGIFGKKGAQEGADALAEGAAKQSWWSKWFGGDSRIGKWFKDSRIGKWFSGIFGKKGADALAEGATKQPWWSRVLGKKVTDKVIQQKTVLSIYDKFKKLFGISSNESLFKGIYNKFFKRKVSDNISEGATKQSWWSKWFGGDSRIGKWFSGIFGKKGAQEGATKQPWWKRWIGKKTINEGAEDAIKRPWWERWFARGSETVEEGIVRKIAKSPFNALSWIGNKLMNMLRSLGTEGMGTVFELGSKPMASLYNLVNNMDDGVARNIPVSTQTTSIVPTTPTQSTPITPTNFYRIPVKSTPISTPISTSTTPITSSSTFTPINNDFDDSFLDKNFLKRALKLNNDIGDATWDFSRFKGKQFKRTSSIAPQKPGFLSRMWNSIKEFFAPSKSNKKNSDIHIEEPLNDQATDDTSQQSTGKAPMVSNTMTAFTKWGSGTAVGILGSILGSFLPIPVLGSALGGWLGYKLGDWIGSHHSNLRQQNPNAKFEFGDTKSNLRDIVLNLISGGLLKLGTNADILFYNTTAPITDNLMNDKANNIPLLTPMFGKILDNDIGDPEGISETVTSSPSINVRRIQINKPNPKRYVYESALEENIDPEIISSMMMNLSNYNRGIGAGFDGNINNIDKHFTMDDSFVNDKANIKKLANNVSLFKKKFNNSTYHINNWIDIFRALAYGANKYKVLKETGVVTQLPEEIRNIPGSILQWYGTHRFTDNDMPINQDTFNLRKIAIQRTPNKHMIHINHIPTDKLIFGNNYKDFIQKRLKSINWEDSHIAMSQERSQLAQMAREQQEQLAQRSANWQNSHIAMSQERSQLAQIAQNTSNNIIGANIGTSIGSNLGGSNASPSGEKAPTSSINTPTGDSQIQIAYKKFTRHHGGKRKHAIDYFTPHAVVGQWTAQKIADYFYSTDRDASSTYGIGKDGAISYLVDEANRPFTTSTRNNDERAITVETASDTNSPYAFTNAAYQSLVKLTADVARRYGKKKVLYLGKEKTVKDKKIIYEPKSDELVLSAHRWFANKACPGDWMYARMANLAESATRLIGNGVTSLNTNLSSNVPVKDNNISSGNFVDNGNYKKDNPELIKKYNESYIKQIENKIIAASDENEVNQVKQYINFDSSSETGSLRTFMLLHPELRHKVLSLAKDYKDNLKKGKITVTSAWRSYGWQEKRYNKWIAGGKKGNLVGKPNIYGNHQQGIGVDISRAQNLQSEGILKKHGLIWPYGNADKPHVESSSWNSKTMRGKGVYDKFGNYALTKLVAIGSGKQFKDGGVPSINNAVDTPDAITSSDPGKPLDPYTKFLNAVKVIFKNEGGYVNDKADRGGKTNLGITEGTLNSARKKNITNISDVKNLTRDVAEKIYYEMYWKPSNSGNLVAPVDLVHFDATVNHGPGSAKKGTGANGLLAKTIAAMGGEATSQNAKAFALKYLDIRDQFYENIIAKNPSQAKFRKGWHNRTNHLRSILDEHIALSSSSGTVDATGTAQVTGTETSTTDTTGTTTDASKARSLDDLLGVYLKGKIGEQSNNELSTFMAGLSFLGGGSADTGDAYTEANNTGKSSGSIDPKTVNEGYIASIKNKLIDANEMAEANKYINFRGNSATPQSFALVRPELRKAFISAAKEYYEKKHTKLGINSAWRSYAYQAGLYANRSKNKNTVAAPSLTAGHFLGTAIDINSADANWLRTTGILDKYGLVQPMPKKDPVHIEHKLWAGTRGKARAAKFGNYAIDKLNKVQSGQSVNDSSYTVNTPEISTSSTTASSNSINSFISNSEDALNPFQRFIKGLSLLFSFNGSGEGDAIGFEKVINAIPIPKNLMAGINDEIFNSEIEMLKLASLHDANINKQQNKKEPIKSNLTTKLDNLIKLIETKIKQDDIIIRELTQKIKNNELTKPILVNNNNIVNNAASTGVNNNMNNMSSTISNNNGSNMNNNSMSSAGDMGLRALYI